MSEKKVHKAATTIQRAYRKAKANRAKVNRYVKALCVCFNIPEETHELKPVVTGNTVITVLPDGAQFFDFNFNSSK